MITDPFSDLALGETDAQFVARMATEQPQQFEHRYVDALAVLVAEEGAGRFARGCQLVAKIWGIPVTQVVTDAACFA